MSAQMSQVVLKDSSCFSQPSSGRSQAKSKRMFAYPLATAFLVHALCPAQAARPPSETPRVEASLLTTYDRSSLAVASASAGVCGDAEEVKMCTDKQQCVNEECVDLDTVKIPSTAEDVARHKAEIQEMTATAAVHGTAAVSTHAGLRDAENEGQRDLAKTTAENLAQAAKLNEDAELVKSRKLEEGAELAKTRKLEDDAELAEARSAGTEPSVLTHPSSPATGGLDSRARPEEASRAAGEARVTPVASIGGIPGSTNIEPRRNSANPGANKAPAVLGNRAILGDHGQVSGFKNAVLKQKSLKELVDRLNDFTTEAQTNAQTVHERLDGYHKSIQALDEPMVRVHQDSGKVGQMIQDEFRALEDERVADFGTVDALLRRLDSPDDATRRLDSPDDATK